ncbi:alpha-latrotoxin-Lg1a-like [Hydra vulgaris]|uniref:alpha-latrotoxin-Lg1a-like n=1 Tax=Hydra vulgaris TaxID=6087 RepID=UPI0032E9EDB0
MVKYLISSNYKVNKNAFKSAAFYEHLHILKYFHSKSLNLRGSKNLIAYAVLNGNLNIIKYLISQNYNVNNDAFIAVVRNEYLDILDYFHFELNLRGSENLIYYAVLNNNLNMIKYLISLNYKVNDQTFFIATLDGRLHILKYFLFELNLRGSDDLINVAVKKGYLDIIKYLISLNYKVNENAFIEAVENNHLLDNDTFIIAAKNRYLHILKYLHSKLNLRGPDDLIDIAVIKGYLNVVKYLISLNYKVNENTFIVTVENNHLHILKYLHSKLNLRGPNNLIDIAIKEGYLDKSFTNKVDFAVKINKFDILKLLIQLGEQGTDWAVINAAQNGNLDIVKYLIFLNYKVNKLAFIYTTNKGLPILKYFHFKLNLRGPENLINFATLNNNLNMIKYLISQNYNVNNDAFIIATEYGRLHILDYFHFELKLRGPENLIKYAIKEGYLNVIKYLISLNYKVDNDTFIIATEYGRLHILKYFHFELNLRGPENLINIVAKEGYLNIKLRGPENLIDIVKKDGYLDSFKYLLSLNYKITKI